MLNNSLSSGTSLSSKPSSYNSNLPETGFVRIQTILAVIPIGKSTWWAGVKSGRFPQPIKLGPKTTAWRVEDIRTLISDMASALDYQTSNHKPQ